MPFEALRFIHAAGLQLDRPLRVTNSLSNDQREAVEDATLRSFETIIISCIEQNVDFLLITGDSFCERERSLRARVALLDGFGRLAEEQIQVFVVPGETDPEHAWRAIPNLPDNVVIFGRGSEEPVAVMRDGHVIASIESIEPVDDRRHDLSLGEIAAEENRQDTHSTGPLTIGIGELSAEFLRSSPNTNNADDDHTSTQAGDDTANTPVSNRTWRIDYLAVINAHQRLTRALPSGIAHTPGPGQGLDRTATGAHGCSIVQVAPGGAIRCSMLPTAGVRFESFSLKVDEFTTQDDLSLQMQSLVEQRHAEDSEDIWLIEWQIRGMGPLFDDLGDAAFAAELFELLELELASAADVSRVHHLQLSPSQKETESFETASRLALEFRESLAAHPPTKEHLQTVLANAGLREIEHTQKLSALMGELNPSSVFEQAVEHGARWFADQPSTHSSE